MVVGSDKQHYYLNELARLKDGKYVIPFSWYYAGKTLTGDCWPVDIVVRYKFRFRFSFHLCPNSL